MKTAILLTGHMRTFARVLKTQYWHVYRRFLPEAEFFISTVKDRDFEPSVAALRALLPQAKIHVDVVDSQPELPIPVPPHAPDWSVGRMYDHEPYAISVHPQAILRQLWQLNRAWEHYSAAKSERYEFIVRIRPDLWFRHWVCPAFKHPRAAYTPWWGRFGGINDRFAVLTCEAAAEAYFTTYAQIETLCKEGCPLHPESLIRASLEKASVAILDTVDANFAKLYGDDNPKLTGTFRDPEMTNFDLAHFAAKGGLH